MALTIDALKGLYEKLGGEDFGDVTTIPEAIDKVTEVATGGGGETYETVAEIVVGTMEQGIALGFPADWWYNAVVPAVPFAMKEGETYYLNDANHPSDSVVVIPETATMLLFNCKIEDSTVVPIEATEPSYAFIDDGNNYIGVCCSENISNTTVTILKKVSGDITVDSELSETSENPVQNKVITAALNGRPVDFIITADFNPETEEITNASASLANVLDVAGESISIVFILHTTAESGGTTVNVYDRFADSNIENYGGGNGVVSFSKVEKDSGTPIIFSIIAASGDHDGKWVYDKMPLATATP